MEGIFPKTVRIIRNVQSGHAFLTINVQIEIIVKTTSVFSHIILSRFQMVVLFFRQGGAEYRSIVNKNIFDNICYQNRIGKKNRQFELDN